MASEVAGLVKFIEGLGDLAKYLERMCELAKERIEPAQEPVVSAPVEPPIEPVVEPPVEPVVASPVEPVVEPVVEPPVEPVVEPVIEPAVAEAPLNGSSNGRRKRRPNRPRKASVDGPRKPRPPRVIITEDKRRAVIAARQRVPQPLLSQVAFEFGISTGSVCNILSRWRAEGGQCAPKPSVLPGQQDLPFKDPAEN